jgi:hypothetical protein
LAYLIFENFHQKLQMAPNGSYATFGPKKVFDALEWLAAMCSHVPNKGEQMVRYYG